MWFTPQIIRDVTKKNRIRKRYIKYGNPCDLDAFKQLRRSIKLEISKAYRQFIPDTESNVQLNPKKFFSSLHINEVALTYLLA